MHRRADDREHLHERVAVLAARDLEDRGPLLLARRRVHERLHLAVALVQRPRPPDDGAPFDAAEVGLAKVALGDSHRSQARAIALGRPLIEIARASGVAVAVLEPLALD